MCGILGIWHLDGRPIDLSVLRRGADCMRHRGPDDEGYVLVETRAGRAVACAGGDTPPVLGLPRIQGMAGATCDLALAHRRLSILDLSPAGHQPMANRNGSQWLVYNGEVYNYLELREELRGKGHAFETRTDTEVVVAAYDQWGADCLRRFNGMWAFALWDAERRTLFCARDRFGIKPLYYWFDGRLFAFASEPKALLQHAAIPAQPNDGVVFDYLNLKQEDHTNETFFRGIAKLPPGHSLELSADGDLRIRGWWDPEVTLELGDTADRHDPDVLRRFAELFEDAIRLRLRSDVPLGTCLSGGLDSSAIVCVANRLLLEDGAVDPALVGGRQKTFSARYRDGRADEGSYMRTVAEATGVDAHEVYPGTTTDLWDELGKLVWHQDEPFVSTSVYAQWNVMRLAQQNGVTVMLDGQGADELLAGYHRYYGSYLAQVMGEHGIGAAWHAACLAARASARDAKLLFLWGLRDRVRSNLRPWMKPLAEAIESGVQPWVHPDFAAAHADRGSALRRSIATDGLAPALQLDMNQLSLPALLRYEDRNSMAFSREARVPFLDYRLVEYLFSLPASYRLGGGWTKWILRTTTAGLVPDEVRWRKRKVGFATPESRWLREGEAFVANLLRSGELKSAPYVQTNILRAARSPSRVPGIWRWINLEVWMRTFL